MGWLVSEIRRRQMPVLGIVLVGALRRFRVEPQRRVVQLLVSDFAGVKADDGMVAHHGKERSAIFFPGPRFVFESQRLEQGILLLRRELQKSLPERLLGPGI